MAGPAPSSKSSSRLDEFVANPRRALWVLSVPILFGMSIQTLYMVVDMIFVGQVSADALTALAFNMPLVFLAMGSTFGLGSAITALIAQAIGARDKERADRVAEHAIVLGGLITVAFTTLGLAYGRSLLRALGVPENLMPEAWSYFRVLATGYVFMVLSIFFRSILSGEGEVKKPVMIQAAATVLNIALDPLFIFTFGMGVAGAAVATVVSQAFAAVALFYLLFARRTGYVDFDFRGFRISAAITSAIFRIGTPASLSFVVMSLGGGIFNRILVEASSDAVAAHQIGSRLDHVVVLPLVAISGSLVTLVGMFYGAGRRDLLVAIVRYAIGRGILIGIAVGVLFYVTAPWVVRVFTDSEEIRRLAVLYLRILAFAYPLFPVSMITGRCLQGLGKGSPELVLSLLRVLLIAAPLAYLFLFVLDLPVHWVWIAAVIASWTSAGIAALWLRSALTMVGQDEAVAEPAPSPAPS